MQKRAKYEETKEVEIYENEEYIKDMQYMAEISNLESKIKEYKAMQIEDAGYKEIVTNLINKGVINEKGEKFIKF